MTKNHDPVIESMKEMGLTDEEIASFINNKKCVNSLFERGYERKRSALQADKGRNKRGHEGPLKTYFREVIEDGASSFDEVLAGLEEHELIFDITGESLT